MLQTRLQTGVCETLMPDVVVPEAHQNDRSCVCELSGPHKHKTVKIEGWALARDNTVHVC